MRWVYKYISIGLLLSSIQLYGQSYNLKVLTLDSDSVTLASLIDKWENKFIDSSGLLLQLNEFTAQLHKQAYLAASWDTIIWQQQQCTALLHLGEVFEWVSLDVSQVPANWLSPTPFRKRDYHQKPLQPQQWANLQEALAIQAANRGFPFAKIELDSLQWLAPRRLKAQVAVTPGKPIFFEEITWEGALRLNKVYLQQHLGWTPGQPYQEKVVQQVATRLQELPFIQLKGSPTVQFIGDQARLRLELEPKQASRFDFVVGVLPRSQQTGRLLVTGQLDAQLQNALGKGERLDLHFDQLRPQTQNLRLALDYPYLLNLPFSLNGGLELYRRDTNFLNLNWQLGVGYRLPNNQIISAFWQRQLTNVLNVDSTLLSRTGRLPDTLDVSRNAFGLDLVWQNLDYRLNPRQGWDIGLRVSAGQRSVRINSQVADFGFAGLYDSLELSSVQYRLAASIDRYFKLGQLSVLKFGLRTAAIIGDAPSFTNEQYRIGGNRLLRGFDEESIFAAAYGLGTLEYRFLLGGNSFLYTFFDAAIIQQETGGDIENRSRTSVQGLGTGISFQTRAGLFGLSLAFGRFEGDAFDFGAPKVHFGYLSLF